jgi:hypothetical protein
MMTYLNPSLQWQISRTCPPDRFERIRKILIALVEKQLDPWPIPPPDDPPSDDYFTPCGGAEFVLTAVEQVDHYHHLRGRQARAPEFWCHPPPELQAMSHVAINILSLLATSASVERSFSTARRLCTDYQMAMNQRTISARVMVQVNWTIAQALLRDVLALGRLGWAHLSHEREQRISERDDPWRLGIPEEDEPWHVEIADEGDARFAE